MFESVPGTNQYQAMRVVPCSQKQREPLIGFQHTTDRLQVRHDTHFYHAAPHVYENTRLLRTHFFLDSIINLVHKHIVYKVDHAYNKPSFSTSPY